MAGNSMPGLRITDSPTIPALSKIMINRLGFTELANGGEHPALDIVLIHGLQGHPEATWSHKGPAARNDGESDVQRSANWFSRHFRATSPHPQSETMSNYWPLNDLARDIKNARILTYGFDSEVSRFFGGTANLGTISDYGESLLNGLVNERVDYPNRPVLFIVHSLGGLVLKSALWQSETGARDDLRRLSQKSFAIIFLGTPHRGSSYASMGETLAQIARATTGRPVNDDLVRSLRGNSEILSNLRKDFAKLMDKGTLEISTFREARALSGIVGFNGMVVGPESASLDHTCERADFIDANHLDMCKFTGQGDPNYKKVLGEIKRHIKGLKQDVDVMSTKCLSSLAVKQMYLRPDEIPEASKYTLEWIYDTSLSQWLQHGHGIYWIQGKPGSGKSTAMKYLVKHEKTQRFLRMSENSIARTIVQDPWFIGGLFITDRGELVQKSWSGILRFVLHQLLCHYSPLVNEILDILQPSTETGYPLDFEHYQWSEKTLEKALIRCKIQQVVPLRFCLFIDGLDEHDGSYKSMGTFLSSLAAISDKDITLIKLCVASRPEKEFGDLFKLCPGFAMQDHTQRDITSVVQSSIYCHPRYAEMNQDEVQHSLELVESIRERAEGSFLWVFHILQELEEGLTNGDGVWKLQERVEQTPQAMENYYSAIISRITPTLRRKAYIMLESILRSRSPLTLLQLCLIVESEESFLDDKPSKVFSKLQIRPFRDSTGLERQVLTACRGFLDVKESEEFHHVFGQHSRVQLLHRSARTYLLEGSNLDILFPEQPSDVKNRHFEKPAGNGHSFILRLCKNLSNLSRYHYEELQCNWELEVEVCYHAPLVEPSNSPALFSILDQIDENISRRSKDGVCWPIEWCRQKRTEHPSNSMSRWHFDFAAYAVSADMTDYTSHLLDLDMTILKSKEGRSLLHFAVFMRGQKENPQMANLLLSRGADIDAQFDGKTVIQSIIPGFRDANASLEMLHVLLEHGANANSFIPLDEETMRLSRYNRFPLLHSVAYMDVAPGIDIRNAWVQLFLNSNADPNSTDSRGRTFVEILYWYGVPLQAKTTWKLIFSKGGKITLPMITAYQRDVRSRKGDAWAVPYTFSSGSHSKYGPLPSKGASEASSSTKSLPVYNPDVNGLPGIYDEFEQDDLRTAPDAYYVLRQPAFRKKEKYTAEAATAAGRYNPGWSTSPLSWLGS